MYVLFADFLVHIPKHSTLSSLNSSSRYRLKKFINIATYTTHITITDDVYSNSYNFNPLSSGLGPMIYRQYEIKSFLTKDEKLVRIDVQYNSAANTSTHCESNVSPIIINMLSSDTTVIKLSQNCKSFETWSKEMSQLYGQSIKTQRAEDFIDTFNRLGEDPKDIQDVISKMTQTQIDTLDKHVNTLTSSQEKYSKCLTHRLDALEHQIKTSSFNYNKLAKSMFKEFTETEVALCKQQSMTCVQDSAIQDLQRLLAQTKRDIQILKMSLMSVCAIGLSCVVIAISLTRM